MRLSFTSLFTILTIIFIANTPNILAAEPIAMQARVNFDSKDQWLVLKNMHLDEVDATEKQIEIITSQSEIDDLRALGFAVDIIHPDISAFYRSRMPDKTMGAYKNLSEIYAYIDSVSSNHPTIISEVVNIGMTANFRDMKAFKISDNPNIDEDEPEILYTACIHAREVITPEVLINFINHLIQNYGTDQEITDMVNGRELWLILMVNPDGYYYNEQTNPGGGGTWRKNRRYNGDGTYGVDLNRNFGYEWGHDNSGSSPWTNDFTYRGPSAFSELETKHIRDFVFAHDFVISAFLHSYSNLLLWPWGYYQGYTPDEGIFAALGDSINNMNGYSPGPSWTLYLTNGTSDDWMYGEQTLKNKIFAVTIEIGSGDDGFWPEPSRIPQLKAENLEPCLFLARIADNLNRLLPPGQPALVAPDTVIATSYEVNWSLIDTLNPPVAYELIEMTDYSTVIDSGVSISDRWLNNGFYLSNTKYSSPPTSFYSGSANSIIHYIQSTAAYHVEPGDTLTFRTYYAIETNWDYAYVEVSTDGLIFTPIPGSITTSYNPQGQNRGNGITGISGSWLTANFSLALFAGQDIYTRFAYYTDGVTIYDGFYIDDVSPVGDFATTHTFTGLTDTSRTFNGNPFGDYMYMVRAQDAQGQWSSYSGPALTYIVPIYIDGDANGDGGINVGDVVFLINNVFKDGPDPSPLLAGDANCDSDINVGDPVYLISFVFKAGPAPNCP